MTSGRRTDRSFFFAFLASIVCVFPVVLFAGHGVEDTVDSISADRVKQLMDAGEKVVLIEFAYALLSTLYRFPSRRAV